MLCPFSCNVSDNVVTHLTIHNVFHFRELNIKSNKDNDNDDSKQITAVAAATAAAEAEKEL